MSAREGNSSGKGSKRRVRMTGQERREQLLDVARGLFANKGYEAVSVEEIADAAGVSKPIVYEHFGGKEGLYAVLVDREMNDLLSRITATLDDEDPRAAVEHAADAFLSYIEEESEGFKVLVRDAPAGSGAGRFGSLLDDIAAAAEGVFLVHYKHRGLPTKYAAIHARAMVGMVASVGEWWLDARKPSRDVVRNNLVELAWYGLRGIDTTKR